MNKRVKQYLCLILVILMLAIMVVPTAKVYARAYDMDGENSSNTELTEGMYLIPYSDYISVSGNLHSHIFTYPYGYEGPYDGGDGAVSQNWSMSGQMATVPQYNDETNYVWQVKSINGSEIHLQAVDAMSVEPVASQTVFTGETATFSVEATPVYDADLQYYWYRVVGVPDYENWEDPDADIYITAEQTLEIGPTNQELYETGAKFYCSIFDWTAINHNTNVATLTISDGYTVTYKSTDGTETLITDEEKYLEGTQVDLDYTNVPTKANCEFAGWATTANSKVATYKKAEDKLTMPEENVTLYAVWNVTKLVDQPTKTELVGKFNFGAELSVTKIEETEETYSIIKAKVLDTQEVIAALEVEVTEAYQGKISITFSVGEKYNGKEVTIYHKKANGTIEELNGTVANGTVTVEVSELSPFMITVASTIAKADTETKLGDAAKTETTTNVKTGDEVVVIACAVIAVLLLVNIILRKNKNKIQK